MKSEREALDREIMELAKQLKYSYPETTKDPESNTDEAFNELGYSVVESEEEEIDIPTEESFLKSSTSASGDDDIVELTSNRPRSVHFEDEYLTDRDSQFVSDYDSICSRQTSHAWSAGSSRTDSNHTGDSRKSSSDSGKSHPPPIRITHGNKESVREILKRRRQENIAVFEHDSRRRVKPIGNSSTELRSRSRSREGTLIDKKSMKNSASLENFPTYNPMSQTNPSKQPPNRPPFSASNERSL